MRLFGSEFLRDFFGDPRGLEINLVHMIFQVVVSLCDRGTAEGICLYNISSGSQILPVDVANDIRSGNGKQIVVALERIRVIFEFFRRGNQLLSVYDAESSCPLPHR